MGFLLVAAVPMITFAGLVDAGVDVDELRTAVWMIVALAGLAVGLHAELLLVQQLSASRQHFWMRQPAPPSSPFHRSWSGLCNKC